MNTKKNKNGSSLVEAMLALSIFGFLVTTLIGAIVYSQDSIILSETRQRASFVAIEGIEAARNLRDGNFTLLADGAYGIRFGSGSWSFVPASTTEDIFKREIIVSTIGENEKQISSKVTWDQNLQRKGEIILTTRLSNWRRISLPPTQPSWQLPYIASSFNLTLANSGNDTADILSATLAGNYIYLGRTTSGGSEFIIINISNPLAPTVAGQRNLNGNPNDIVINGNYAYVASSDNSSELQIIDISDPATINQAGKLTSVDLTNANSGNSNADAVRLSLAGSYLCMIRNGGDSFLIFNLSNPSNPGNPVGRMGTLIGTPQKILTNGNYAYAASSDNAAELQIIDINNKTSPLRIAILNLNSGNNNADAISLALSEGNLLLGRANSAAPELYQISISNPLSPSLLSTMEIGANVNSIFYDSMKKLIFLATTDIANDFKTVYMETSTLPAALNSQLNTADTMKQIIYSSASDTVFSLSTNDSSEIEIIKTQ